MIDMYDGCAMYFLFLYRYIALHKAYAAEAVYKETQSMKVNSSNIAKLNINLSKTYFHCGKSVHMAKIISLRLPNAMHVRKYHRLGKFWC